MSAILNPPSSILDLPPQFSIADFVHAGRERFTMASKEASVPLDLGGASNLIQGVAKLLHLQTFL